MAERSVIVCVGAQDLDPIRIDIEPDLPGGDLHRRPYRYPVMPVDALSDREFDLVHARRVDAQSAEVAGAGSSASCCEISMRSSFRAGGGLHSQGLFR